MRILVVSSILAFAVFISACRKPAIVAEAAHLASVSAASRANSSEIAHGQPLFRSGFESEVYLDPVHKGSYQYLRGADMESGFGWPITAFSPHPDLTGIQNVIRNGQSEFLAHAIETINGPNGRPSRALLLKLTSQAQGQRGIQAALQTSALGTDVRDVYARYWMKLNPEFLDQARSQTTGFWRMTWEMKTMTDYRLAPMIYADSAGRPYWFLRADNNASGCSNCQTFWTVTNRDVPVPTDRWFLMEFYIHRSADIDGRVFWAADGKVIADRWGANMGANNEKVDVIMYANLYGTAFPMYEWLDDVEIWAVPPCGTLPCGAAAAPDREAPSQPTNLIATPLSFSQIELNWAASTDNVGVAGYRLYRDGGQEPIASITGTLFTDSGLTELSKHTYTVVAYDEAGNVSARSEEVTATTLATPLNLVRGMIASSSTGLTDAVNMTDGDTSSLRWTGGGPGSQWIQFDLGRIHAVNGLTIWHYHEDGRTYRDVIVQLSSVPDFDTGVTTVFNNDADNSSGQGSGSDPEYAETANGKNIQFQEVAARYVRIWGNGSNINEWNHYCEVHVYGEAAGGRQTALRRGTKARAPKGPIVPSKDTDMR